MKPLLFLLAALSFAQAALAATPAPAMVSIPKARITTIACPGKLLVCDHDAYVERTVDIPAFEMGKTEVTFDEWDACVKDNACTSPVSEWAYENRPVAPPCVEGAACQYPADGGWGRGKRPVINVSWKDVQGYIAWLNAKTGSHYRLPSSAEWEYAALAGASTRFPWGAKVGKNNANCDGCGSKWDNRQTAPVGSFKPNRFGLHDMIGNVNEWTSTCFPARIPGSQECNTYMYRGGSWQAVASAMNPLGYQDLLGNLRKPDIGFRLAR